MNDTNHSELDMVGCDKLEKDRFRVYGPGDGFDVSRAQLVELARYITEALKE